MVSLVKIGSEVYQQGAYLIIYIIGLIKISRLSWECLMFGCVLPCLAVIAAWTFCRTHVSVNAAFVFKCKLAWDVLICWSTGLPVSCFLVGTCLDFLALPVRGFNPTYFLPTFYLSSLRRRVKPTKSIREVFATVAHNKMWNTWKFHVTPAGWQGGWGQPCNRCWVTPGPTVQPTK